MRLVLAAGDLLRVEYDRRMESWALFCGSNKRGTRLYVTQEAAREAALKMAEKFVGELLAVQAAGSDAEAANRARASAQPARVQWQISERGAIGTVPGAGHVAMAAPPSPAPCEPRSSKPTAAPLASLRKLADRVYGRQ